MNLEFRKKSWRGLILSGIFIILVLFLFALVQLFSVPALKNQLSNEDTPRSELLSLRESMKVDRNSARNCHPRAHEVGRNAYAKFESFEKAAQFQDSVCNSGYIHGVIESHLKDSEDIQRDLRELCAAPFKSTFDGWQCFHGVGHGVMYYTNNNLPLSIQYCLSLPDTFSQQNCANGVYMENFSSDENLHPSEFVKDDELFYPCNSEKLPFKSDCYYYAPIKILSKNGNDYSKAFENCLTTEKEVQSYCIAGVSGQAVKDNFDDFFKVDKICAEGPTLYLSSCIHSMVSMYFNMLGGIGEGEKICRLLADDHKKYCLEEVESKREEFISI